MPSVRGVDEPAGSPNAPGIDGVAVGIAPQQQRRCVTPAWRCTRCERECVAVRSESRCLCGHRLHQHKQAGPQAVAPFRCAAEGCTCPAFFHIIAEGSWVIRCRCKHRHTDHDPVTHACRRPSCGCTAFCSPFVCNCDHAWADHEMVLKEQQVSGRLAEFARLAMRDPGLVAADLAAPGGGPGWAEVQRGQ